MSSVLHRLLETQVPGQKRREGTSWLMPSWLYSQTSDLTKGMSMLFLGISIDFLEIWVPPLFVLVLVPSTTLAICPGPGICVLQHAYVIIVN